ncbi:type II secretion system F family protein [Marinomonas ostreistagni]|uniref:Type II secretion system F family protein n=1 Tax=Marinomonas ostreistagni TaxID=359209 RepID=A0ABS0ZCY8_9GAMM|nr:type II secretion system F family protein [Marinomonas ostreistagni]MBJ7551482.1 type II secretion system F family protein [Marinomonas ostreistagni]
MLGFFAFLTLLGLVGYFYFSHQLKRSKHIDYLNEYSRSEMPKLSKSSQQVVDLKSLSGRTFFDKLKNRWLNLLNLLGKQGTLKLTLFYVVLALVAKLFNDNFVQSNYYLILAAFLVFGSFVGYTWLQSKQHKSFEEVFPVALNMLTSAVSAGESITQAISYVGESLDGRVADEFRIMGKRLQLGEAPEEVFRKACVRFPYPTFYFFVITIQANMERGGQLKDIIQRLNRLMFNIRAIEKKKYALTSEARTSAKIVGAIPFIFLIMMRFLSPENFDFVMNDSEGRKLLYYMLSSEAIGIAIIWGLMKSVR